MTITSLSWPSHHHYDDHAIIIIMIIISLWWWLRKPVAVTSARVSNRLWVHNSSQQTSVEILNTCCKRQLRSDSLSSFESTHTIVPQQCQPWIPNPSKARRLLHNMPATKNTNVCTGIIGCASTHNIHIWAIPLYRSDSVISADVTKHNLLILLSTLHLCVVRHYNLPRSRPNNPQCRNHHLQFYMATLSRIYQTPAIASDFVWLPLSI